MWVFFFTGTLFLGILAVVLKQRPSEKGAEDGDREDEESIWGYSTSDLRASLLVCGCVCVCGPGEWKTIMI